MPSATFGFTGKPVSSVVKTGTYVIPAGNYAYITAHCKAGETVSVDGTVICDGSTAPAVAAVATGSNSSSANFTYTVPTGSYFEGQVSQGATDTLTIGALNVVLGGSTNSTSVRAGTGQAVTITSGGGATVKTITGYSINLFSGTPVTMSFWVPTGTSMTTSSGRYLVQLY